MEMFWNEPRIWMRVSASTMRVFVAFSMVNLVLPLCARQGNALSATDCMHTRLVAGQVQVQVQARRGSATAPTLRSNFSYMAGVR